MKKKYFVTLEYPAPDNCYRGEVTWKEVEARSEKEAKYKARLAAMHRIKVNCIKEVVKP